MNLTSEVEECVRRLFTYFKKTHRYSNNFKRILKALGINLRTVYKIINESSVKETEPNEREPIASTSKMPKNKNDEFDMSLIRNTVHSVYRAGKFLSIRKLQKLLEKKGMVMARTTLARGLKSLGFKFYSQKSRRFITETSDIVSWRHSYLRAIRKFRNEGYDTVYLDETWINAHHANPGVWTENRKGPTSALLHNCTDCERVVPSGKGSRLIVLDAGSPKQGFIPDVGLVFQSKTKSEDYHDEMNHQVFLEWFENTLLPALPEPSVIIMDNAPYHNKKTPESWYPRPSTKKADVKDWLKKNNIDFDENELKSELLKKVLHNKPQQMFITDQMAMLHGHEVLRLPPRHCELNPIELIQGEEKNYIARENYTFKMADVKELFMESKARITKTSWEKATNYVIQHVEDKFWSTDGVIDEITPVVVNVQDSSDSDSDVQSEDFHECDNDNKCEESDDDTDNMFFARTTSSGMFI